MGDNHIAGGGEMVYRYVMAKLIVAIVSLLSLSVVFAMAPEVNTPLVGNKIAQEASKVERGYKVASATKNDIQLIVSRYAFIYDVSETELFYVIGCESSFNQYAVGDGGHSRGLVQIHDTHHPEVSHEEAFSPEYAIRFLAKAISENKGGQWTCWRKYKRL